MGDALTVDQKQWSCIVIEERQPSHWVPSHHAAAVQDVEQTFSELVRVIEYNPWLFFRVSYSK